jgi:hypothetical protein
LCILIFPFSISALITREKKNFTTTCKYRKLTQCRALLH